jgi:hypothetical protein
MDDFVSDNLCRERRESCKDGRIQDCESRDAWIGKLEKKIDNLIYLAIGQLCALVLTLVGIIIVGR